MRNLMAHTQKPDFVFRLNGRVHLNWRGSQFSWLLAAKVCASALVMPDTPRSEVVWEYWLPIPFASFPFTSPPARHHVPPHSECTIEHGRAEKSTRFYQRKSQGMQLLGRNRWEEYIKMSLKEVEGKCVGWLTDSG
jgi:hypothetical protein